MRISDWSSDVCSSDLSSAAMRCPPRWPMPDALMVGATGMVGRAVIGHFGSTSVTVLARREVEGLAPHHRELVAPSERWADIIAEIGREACRERGCQYV